jgi:hypothetical protein
VIPLVGLVELAAALHQPRRAPTVEEWHAVRGAVAGLRKADELVVVAPRWAEPNARHAFGDELMPFRDVARPDESAYARAIEVSILGERAPELSGFRSVSERKEGKFVVRVLENPRPARVVYDFLDHVEGATVLDLTPTGEKPCRWNPAAPREAGGLHGTPAFPARRHQCSGASWHFVGVTAVEDEEWRGRRCLWAHPPSGATLVIRFPDVPLGDVVRGYGTLPYWTEREKRGAPVEMEVRAGGVSLGSYTHADGEGWKPFELQLREQARKRADVEFRVRSSRTQYREFCFQADTR